MAITDFDKIIRYHKLETSGWNAVAGQWTDFGPHGNHVAPTGTPTISTVGGVTAWAPALDGSTYLEHRAPRGTFSVMHTSYWDSTNFSFIYWLHNGTYASDDHSALTNTSANWSSTDTAYHSLNNGASAWQNATGTPSAADTYTKAQWNVHTLVMDLENAQMKYQLNDDAPVIAAASSWLNMVGTAAELVRFGHMTLTSITGTVGHHMLAEFSGDILADQSSRHATEVAALKTELSIP